MFSVFVGIFAIIEHIVEGMLHGKGVFGGLEAIWHEGKDEIFSRCLVTFFAFIPFFAFRELGELLGEGRLHRVFFRRDAAAQSGAQG